MTTDVEFVIGGMILAFILFQVVQIAWYVLSVTRQHTHSWWQYVEEAERRERFAAMRAKYPILWNPLIGGWYDIGFTDTRDNGFTLSRED